MGTRRASLVMYRGLGPRGVEIRFRWKLYIFRPRLQLVISGMQ